jgi:hypothetical protein
VVQVQLSHVDCKITIEIPNRGPGPMLIPSKESELTGRRSTFVDSASAFTGVTWLQSHYEDKSGARGKAT